MSQQLRASLLSYQIPKADRHIARSSSTESLPSPHGSTQSRGSPPLRQGRPPLSPRPHSLDKRNKQRIRVQIMEEQRDSRASSEQKKNVTPQTSEDINRVNRDTNSGTPKSVREESDEVESSRPPTPATHGSSSVAKEKARRPGWTRTRSGGVWYQSNTSPYDSGSTKSRTSYFSAQEETETSRIDISPLKPPPRPEVLVSEPVNQVVVELPFGHHQHPRGDTVNSLDAPDIRERRRSSIDVKRLFSAPLTILRRSLREKPSRIPSPTPDQTEATHTPMSDASHRPFFKRDWTAVTLDRVSSLLEAQGRPNLKGRIRSWTHKSVTTPSSSDPNESRQSRNKGTIAVSFPVRRGSLKNVIENTSSIWNLHLGATPPNSTSEKATYRVRQRSSAESEEFLKIDISIRGGTSYLPSEARRITTPPLPGSNSVRSRRGFFFDYKAPDWDEVVCPDQRGDTLQHGNSSTKFETIGSATLARMHSSASRKRISKTKTGEWYDAQLADLDAVSETSLPHPSPLESHEHCRHECQTQLAEIRRQKFEAQLDFTIPEHLPTSPLCPRNPRYWRVKEQKGSQFRGCWMHGFGEYDIVPGMSKK